MPPLHGSSITCWLRGGNAGLWFLSSHVIYKKSSLQPRVGHIVACVRQLTQLPFIALLLQFYLHYRKVLYCTVAHTPCAYVRWLTWEFWVSGLVTLTQPSNVTMCFMSDASFWGSDCHMQICSCLTSFPSSLSLQVIVFTSLWFTLDHQNLILKIRKKTKGCVRTFAAHSRTGPTVQTHSM